VNFDSHLGGFSVYLRGCSRRRFEELCLCEICDSYVSFYALLYISFAVVVGISLGCSHPLAGYLLSNRGDQRSRTVSTAGEVKLSPSLAYAEMSLGSHSGALTQARNFSGL
jgi:hypothetical protein